MPRDKQTVGVMIRTQMAWDYLKSGVTKFPRLGHRNYFNSDKVVFYNHYEGGDGRSWKADLVYWEQTTIGELSQEDCLAMNLPENLSTRVVYLREFWMDDELDENSPLTIMTFEKLRGHGVNTNWRGAFPGMKE